MTPPEPPAASSAGPDADPNAGPDVGTRAAPPLPVHPPEGARGDMRYLLRLGWLGLAVGVLLYLGYLGLGMLA